MFADFAKKSIAVCVSSIKVVSEMSPFGRGEGAIVATCLTIELRQNRVRLMHFCLYLVNSLTYLWCTAHYLIGTISRPR